VTCAAFLAPTPRADLPDLTAFLLATGCRIGEALAVGFGDVNLDEKSIAIEAHIIRVKGVGVVRVAGTKTGGGEEAGAGSRTLRLPDGRST
jgi:integrase